MNPPRYPHDDVLLKPRSFRYILRLILHSARFHDFLWLLATLAIMTACAVIGFWQAMRGPE